MISIQKRFLFIHIPKTGGNSIQSILQKYSEDELTQLATHQDGIERFGIQNEKYKYNKHSTLTEYKKILEPNLYKSLFKFTVVRNPWDRMISYYFSPHFGRKDFIRKDFMELLKKTSTLSYYANELNFPQKICYKFGYDLRPEKTLGSDIDFFIKFENLDSDFKKLCHSLDIDYVPLPSYNKSSRKKYAEYYDPELKNLVLNKFRKEINFFNYSFEDID